MKAIVFTLLISLLPVSLATGGSLHGIVRNATTHTPLEGVNVTVHVVVPDSIPFPAMTDSDGLYSITGIIPGNQVYAVVTYIAGFVPSYARIDNLGSLDVEYDIDLTPEPFVPPGEGDSSTVAGVVKTLAPGTGLLIPVGNVQVTLVSGNMQSVATTNSTGSYELNVPVGLYSAQITATGYNDLIIGGINVESIGATVNAVLQRVAVGVPPDNGGRQAQRFVLYDAYPNPFNPNTVIRYELPVKSVVTLKIYDMLGREVATLVDGEQGAGVASVVWTAGNNPSGVYFCKINAGNFTEAKKILLVR